MLAFRAGSGAGLRFECDFSIYDYVNLSFLEGGGADIPFHLSLRRADGVAAINTRVRGVWGEERATEVSLAMRGERASVLFDGSRISIRLNGSELGRLSGTFDDLELIAKADFHGGVRPASVHLEPPAGSSTEPEGEVGFSSPFTIEGWAHDPTAWVQDMSLDVADLEPAPLAAAWNLPESEGARTGFMATVPGRVWAATSGEAVEIRPRVNGREFGSPVVLRRREALGMAEAVLTDPAMRGDACLGLLALEHVRFAGLHDALSVEARNALHAIAKLYQVDRFLFPGKGLPPATPASRTPDERLVDEARTLVSQALRRDRESPSGALRRVPDLPEVPLRRLCLELAGVFCDREAFEELHAFSRLRGVTGFERDRYGMETAAAFPFLLMEGRVAALPEAITALHVDMGDHVDTGALGWTMRALAQDRPVHVASEPLEETTRAYLDLIDRWSAVPWGRTACASLTRAAVSLLAKAGRFGNDLGDEIEAAVLRVHGLSARFWNALDAAVEAGELHPSPALVAGREAFSVLERAARRTEAHVEEALAFFERRSAAAAVRARLTLLGPAGATLREGEGFSEAIHRIHADAGPFALRALAAPGWQPRSERDACALARVARKAVIDAFEDDLLPRAPHAELQENAVRAAAAAAQELADETTLDALAGDCMRLARAADRHVGACLGTLVLDRLVHAGQERLAQRQLEHLSCILEAVPVEERGTLFGGPALSSAVFALRRTEERTGNAVATAGLRLLSSAGGAYRLPPGRASDTGFFDIVVCVMSCRSHLESRLPPLGEGWLSRLAAFGVPFLVMVGGAPPGEARQEGDVVHLDAPDDYEGLPEKVLAAVRWVHDRTPFGHMLKIDDDSALDVDGFLHAQGYRKIDAYGRHLFRHPGQMDRLWHLGKSSSDRGRLELDKSPEPSTYADGGSGYALSRRAMSALLWALHTRDGARLRLNAFMEDKLVGDLLSLAGFGVEEEDYRVAIWRRTSGSDIPTPCWENGFYASAAAPIVQMHLDSPDRQAAAEAARGLPVLRPGKLWPVTAPPRLGYNSHALELVSGPEKLERVNARNLVVICVVRNEMAMLPSFLSHYRGLGIGGFLFVDNRSDDGTLDFVEAQSDAAVFTADSDYQVSQYGAVWQETLLANLRPGRWSLMADADEFLEAGEGLEDLPGALEGEAFADADAVRVMMLDMYPSTSLAEAVLKEGVDPFGVAGFVDRTPFLDAWPGRGRFSDTPTWTSALRRRLFPEARSDVFVAQKIAVLRYRPWMRLSAGLHYVAETRLAKRDMIFGHFKYHAGFAHKVLEEIRRGQHFNDAEEYRRYLDLPARGGGTLFEPGVSVPWRDSPVVARILAGERLDPSWASG